MDRKSVGLQNGPHTRGVTLRWYRLTLFIIQPQSRVTRMRSTPNHGVRKGTRQSPPAPLIMGNQSPSAKKKQWTTACNLGAYFNRRQGIGLDCERCFEGTNVCGDRIRKNSGVFRNTSTDLRMPSIKHRGDKTRFFKRSLCRQNSGSHQRTNNGLRSDLGTNLI